MEVTYWGGLGGLHVGDWAGLSHPGRPCGTFGSAIWTSFLAGLSFGSGSECLAWFGLLTYWAIQFAPAEWQQPPGPTGGPLWPRKVLIHLKCPVFLAGRLCPSSGMGECWWVPVLHFSQAVHLSSAIGSLLGRPRCPSWPLMLIWAHTAGPGQPLKWVHLVGNVSNLIQGVLVSYQLDGRCICLYVQSWETMSVTMAY